MGNQLHLKYKRETSCSVEEWEFGVIRSRGRWIRRLMNGREWTPDEDKYLTERYPDGDTNLGPNIFITLIKIDF